MNNAHVLYAETYSDLKGYDTNLIVYSSQYNYNVTLILFDN